MKKLLFITLSVMLLFGMSNAIAFADPVDDPTQKVTVNTAAELQAAVENTAYKGYTICLGDSFTTTAPLDIKQDLTLELNEKTLTLGVDNGIQITGGATVTIGYGRLESDKGNLITASGGGKATLIDAYIYSTGTNISAVQATGTGSSITVTSGVISSAAGTALRATNGASVSVNGGYITGAAQFYAVVADGGNATATISGGTMKGSVGAGSDIDGNGNSVIISGGTITGDVGISGNKGTITVTGGSFSDDDISTYVADTGANAKPVVTNDARYFVGDKAIDTIKAGTASDTFSTVKNTLALASVTTKSSLVAGGAKITLDRCTVSGNLRAENESIDIFGSTIKGDIFAEDGNIEIYGPSTIGTGTQTIKSGGNSTINFFETSAAALAGDVNVDVSKITAFDTRATIEIGSDVSVKTKNLTAAAGEIKISGGTTIADTISKTSPGIFTFTGGTILATTGISNITTGCTITFVTDTPVTGTVFATEKIISGNKAIAPPTNPTKTGYTFDGWYYGSTKFNFAATTVTSNLTLNANWTITSYTVTFNTNGGSAVAPQIVNYNGLVTKPAVDPVKANCIFAGWYRDSTCYIAWDFAKDKVTEVTTIYAKWYTLGNNSEIRSGSTVKSCEDSTGKQLVKGTDYTLINGGALFNTSYTDTFRGTRTVTMIIGDKYYLLIAVGTRFPPIDINTLSITVTDPVYTGAKVLPAVTIKDATDTAIDPKFYTVESADASTAIGTHSCTITGKDDYTGTVTRAYKIIPVERSLTKVTKGQKSFTAKWKAGQTAAEKNISGYQVRYSLKKSMTNAKTKNASAKAVKVTVKKLKSKKTYYVQLRTYKTADGVKYYSNWSKTVKVKTK